MTLLMPSLSEKSLFDTANSIAICGLLVGCLATKNDHYVINTLAIK